MALPSRVRRIQLKRAARSLGTAGPCQAWYGEVAHSPHVWEHGQERCACPGYRPLEDVRPSSWDFNWSQPSAPLQPGDIVTADHLNSLGGVA